MPIPEFREDGWLPNGHHAANWEEIVVRFGGKSGSRREQLTVKLSQLREALHAVGVPGTILEDSPARGMLSTLWDCFKEGVAKGVVDFAL